MQGSPNHKHGWVVILSGGDGIRLRPLTRLLAGDDRPELDRSIRSLRVNPLHHAGFIGPMRAN